MKVKLQPIEHEDLEILHRWLNKKHLVPFYMQEPISSEEVLQKFRPRVGGKHKTKCMFAFVDGIPFGYVQWYLNRSYPDYGVAVIKKEFGFSIDYFIGEVDYLGKALGSSMFRLLVEQTFPLLEPGDRIAYIAHDNRNSPAIRCTQRAGFKKDSQFSENDKDCTLYAYHQ